MEKLIVSPSPHLREGISTRKIMRDVIIAMIPAIIASVVLFGPRAALIIAVSVTSCVLCEYFSRKIMKKPNTIRDLSCIVTGILLAFSLPVTIHPLIAAFGGLVAIVVVKEMFGGLGQNFVNPALTARIILLNSFPSRMTTWTAPFLYLRNADATTAATPLDSLGGGLESAPPDLLELFIGTHSGCLGETCVFALLLGGTYLVVRQVITPVIPACFLGTAALVSFLAGRNVLVDLFSGGLLLGAIFMATDYTTSPITTKGKVLFAVGCGLMTMLIRIFGSLPEGVSYAILLMNLLVPLIERLTRPKPFGRGRVKSET